MSRFNPFGNTAAPANNVEVRNIEVPENFTSRRAARRFGLNQVNVINGQAAVEHAVVPLAQVQERINALGANAEIPEALTQEYEQASRNFTRARSQLGFAHGKLGDSVVGMFRSMGSRLGINTENLGAGIIRGNSAEAVTHAFETRTNWFERSVSKPFRIAAEHPRVALGAIALGAVAVVGNAIRGGAAKRTQHNAEQQIAALQQQQALAAAQQSAPVSYMNSASQADVEARMAADRAAGAAPATKAEAVTASQAASLDAASPAV